MDYLETRELYHHGIKGQKWGVRRYQYEDGTLTPAGRKRYLKMAKKDAKEYTLAKMYTKEGAGNRRKKIKAIVEERSKDPFYKEAFEREVANTDMVKRTRQAQRQRQNKDAFNIATNIARNATRLIGERPSEEEMKDAIKRKQLENTYDKLFPKEKTRLEKTVDDLNAVPEQINRISNSVSKVNAPKSKRMDLSKMTDKEMRDRINRELLERQYNDLFNPPSKAERGKEQAMKALQTMSTITSLGVSALGLAVAMQKLRGKGN